MTQWKNIASVIALSMSSALAGTGCLAQGAGDETASEPESAATAPVAETTAAASDLQGDETTGEASQACFGGFGGFGRGFGGFGRGFGGFGGFDRGFGFGGFPGFGGCEGFGGLGGCGGFGGCGGGW